MTPRAMISMLMSLAAWHEAGLHILKQLDVSASPPTLPHRRGRKEPFNIWTVRRVAFSRSEFEDNRPLRQLDSITTVWYNSSCLDITSTHAPDPWITHANGKFYLLFTGNNRVPMWSATSLKDFSSPDNANLKKGPVFRARDSGPLSERLWAPELHCLRGRWYIYFAAADKAKGNRSHRMNVLGGPEEGKDPHEGLWELLGPIKGMDQRQWAIDGTVFEVDGGLYFCYSGWPRKEGSESGWEERSEKIQELFILKLRDPVTAESEAVRISTPEEDWERLVKPGIGINEGPQWLESPSEQWKGLVYSCSASWTKQYKMATLQYLPAPGQGPLDPESWVKSRGPLLQNRPDGKGPFGPGHGCFLHAKGESVALFHATDRETDGNQNRRCRMQRVRWTERGPDMGSYVGVGTEEWESFMRKMPS